MNLLLAVVAGAEGSSRVGDHKLELALTDLARFIRVPLEEGVDREVAVFFVKGFEGLNGLLLFFNSEMSCFKVSSVRFSPGNFESIACATRRSENWFSNSAHEDAFSSRF